MTIERQDGARSGPRGQTTSRLIQWFRPPEGSGARDDRALLGRILFAMIWMPIQVVLSLFIATGGLMLLLVLGILLSPFIGLFLLVRYLVRRASSG